MTNTPEYIPVHSAKAHALGLTKARLMANLVDRAGDAQFADDDAYVAFVCAAAGLEALPASALDSYVDQHADKAIKDLEAAITARFAG